MPLVAFDTVGVNQAELPVWKANPERLVSLYEIAVCLGMEFFEAAIFYKMGRMLESFASSYGMGLQLENIDGLVDTSLDEMLSPLELNNFKSVILSTYDACTELKLEGACEYATDIIHRASIAQMSKRTAGVLLRELHKHIKRDMEKEKFIHIPASRAKFYNLVSPMGPEVDAAFPSARFDLIQAGNCFASGAYTASGMHLMRAVEIAIWELGRDRHIPLAESNKIEFTEWGKIIEELETAVEEIQQWPNSPAKEDAHKFYNRALLEIRSFNDGIRRHLAHVRKFQDPMEMEEALANWGHVSRFMKRLAERIGEGKYMPLKWS